MIIPMNKAMQNSIHADRAIAESAIYQKLLRRHGGRQLTNEELRDCHCLVAEHLPEMNELLASRQYMFSRSGYRVCMLLRFGFKPKDISGMLDLTPGRVSQICAKALHDFFGEENGGAAELAEKLRQIG